MSALIDVILPVYLVIAAGYLAAWRGLMPPGAIDGVMRYATAFAVPVLLFAAMARIDLGAVLNPPLLISFYAGAFAGFFFAFFGALYIFGRDAEDAVAIGFCGMFSNSLLLGLPITERAYGSEALTWNYTIVSIHAPLIYTFGITMMEAARSRGRGLPAHRLARQVIGATLKNPLVAGILAGFALNVSGLELPAPGWSAVEMIRASAIPAALFALGGVLLRYRPEGDGRTIAWVCLGSLIVHPAITWGLARGVFDLDTGPLRSAVVTASMAPGINAYLFADLYGRGRRVAASTALIATGVSILTIWFWLSILP